MTKEEIYKDALELIVRSSEWKGASDVTREDWMHWAGRTAREALKRGSVEPSDSLKMKFECEGKGCFRQFVIEYQPGAKILGGTCICGHYTPFKEPTLRTTP